MARTDITTLNEDYDGALNPPRNRIGYILDKLVESGVTHGKGAATEYDAIKYKDLVGKPSINGTVLDGQLYTHGENKNLELGIIDSYEDLQDLPSINGITIIGDKSNEEFGIHIVTDYDELKSRPSINGVLLSGDVSLEELGVPLKYNDLKELPSINDVEINGKQTTADWNLDYNYILNHPTINGVELINDVATKDLGINYSDILNPPKLADQINVVHYKGEKQSVSDLQNLTGTEVGDIYRVADDTNKIYTAYKITEDSVKDGVKDYYEIVDGVAKVTDDTDFQEGKTYYEIDDTEGYIKTTILPDGYQVTSDEIPIEGKTYYTRSDDIYTPVTDLTAFKENTDYYEVVKNATDDDIPVSGKKYYIYNDDTKEYTATGNISEFDPDEIYYEDGYQATSDETPVKGKTYYTFTKGEYTERTDLTEFTSGETYYEYKKAPIYYEKVGSIYKKTSDTFETQDINKTYYTRNDSIIISSISPNARKYFYIFTGDLGWLNITTLYGAFTGATEETDGEMGYVPAPNKDDRYKFLRGDGFWIGTDSNVSTESNNLIPNSIITKYVNDIRDTLQTKINSLSNLASSGIHFIGSVAFENLPALFNYVAQNELTEFDSDETYYEAVVTSTDNYSVTSDATPDSTKTYYTKNDADETYNEITAGSITEFTVDTVYYEKTTTETTTYKVTEDKTPDENKTYYLRESMVAEGNMYNITNDFTTTTDFVEGAGIDCPAGTNIVVNKEGLWDLFAIPGVSSGSSEGGTTNYKLLTNKPSINGVSLNGNLITTDLKISYNDLLDKPDLSQTGTTDYTDLTNKPKINGVELSDNILSSNLNLKYTDLSDIPTINGVNVTGALTTSDLKLDYADILNTPDLSNVGSKDYTDLTNKPTINGVELKGALTSDDLGLSSNTQTVTPTINGVSVTGDLTTSDLKLEYNDILNIPTKPVELIQDLKSTDTEITFSNSAIKDGANITIYTTIYGFAPSSVTQTDNSLTLTFTAEHADCQVKVVIS